MGKLGKCRSYSELCRRNCTCNTESSTDGTVAAAAAVLIISKITATYSKKVIYLLVRMIASGCEQGRGRT